MKITKYFKILCDYPIWRWHLSYWKVDRPPLKPIYYLRVFCFIMMWSIESLNSRYDFYRKGHVIVKE